jgi:hypothetical protein
LRLACALENCAIPLMKLGDTEGDVDLFVAETNRQTRVMSHSTCKLSSEEFNAIFTQAL